MPSVQCSALWIRAKESGNSPVYSELSHLQESHGRARNGKDQPLDEGNSRHNGHVRYFKKSCKFEKLRAED